MLGYNITELSPKTQDLIRQNNLDTNQDGRINEENGELAELLTQTGKKDINELLYDNWWEGKTSDGLGVIFGGVVAAKGASLYLENEKDRSFSAIKKQAQKIFAQKNPDMPISVSEEVPRTIVYQNDDALEQLKKLDKAISGDTYEFALKNREALQAKLDQERLSEIAQRKLHNQKCKEWKPKYGMDKVFNDIRKGFVKSNVLKYMGLATAVAGLALSAYFVLRKPEKTIQMQDDQATLDTTVSRYSNEWEEKYSDAFGKDVALNEYIPEKGEYWVSILQAKYSVDSEIAQKMANKIKEMIYGNATIAKQTPIMYLPQTWTFEGVTYNYDADAVPEKTTEFSDDVITDQGKMSKDLEY